MDKDKPGVTKFISPAQFTSLMGDAPKVMNKMVKGVVAKANASGVKEFDMLVHACGCPTHYRRHGRGDKEQIENS